MQLREIGHLDLANLDLGPSGTGVEPAPCFDFAKTRGRLSPAVEICANNGWPILGPFRAKNSAIRCSLVRPWKRTDLRKLHTVARLRKLSKRSGGFDSLPPLQFLKLYHPPLAAWSVCSSESRPEFQKPNTPAANYSVGSHMLERHVIFQNRQTLRQLFGHSGFSGAFALDAWFRRIVRLLLQHISN